MRGGRHRENVYAACSDCVVVLALGDLVASGILWEGLEGAAQRFIIKLSMWMDSMTGLSIVSTSHAHAHPHMTTHIRIRNRRRDLRTISNVTLNAHVCARVCALARLV